MTFEQVLKVFEEYLKQDTECEVLKNSHGYVTMIWDERGKDWNDVVQCMTPEELRESLLEKYCRYASWINSDGEKDLTDDEVANLEKECIERINSIEKDYCNM